MQVKQVDEVVPWHERLAGLFKNERALLAEGGHALPEQPLTGAVSVVFVVPKSKHGFVPMRTRLPEPPPSLPGKELRKWQQAAVRDGAPGVRYTFEVRGPEHLAEWQARARAAA